MNTDNTTHAPDPAPFETPSECRAAFDTLLARAPRELRLYDRNLELWQLDAPPRHAALRALCVAGGGRRIECLLDDTHHIARLYPRLMQLVRDFGHVIALRQNDPDVPSPDQAFVIADREGVLLRADKASPQGTLHAHDSARATTLQQRFDAMWQRASLQVSATTLGL